MTTITNTASFIPSVSRQGQQNSGNIKTNTAEKSILDSIQQSDPEKADALKKMLDDTKQAESQLRAGGRSAAQSKKASAAEKVKNIKDQIKMLKMMGGDPRMIAKQIAQLARDLSSAAREYASGSKDIALFQDSAESAMGDGTAGNTTTATSDRNNDTKESLVASADVSAAIVSSETATSDKTAGNAAASVSQEPITAVPAGNSLQRAEVAQEKLKEDWQKKNGELGQKSSEATAAREFVQEVRMLAAQLKALANQHKQRLQQGGEQKLNHDLSQTNQALVEIEKSVSGISAAGMSATITVNTFA